MVRFNKAFSVGLATLLLLGGIFSIPRKPHGTTDHWEGTVDSLSRSETAVIPDRGNAKILPVFGSKKRQVDQTTWDTAVAKGCKLVDLIGRSIGSATLQLGTNSQSLWIYYSKPAGNHYKNAVRILLLRISINNAPSVQTPGFLRFLTNRCWNRTLCRMTNTRS